MKKIIDYKIIDGITHKILEANVKKSLEDGYQPYGSIFASIGNGDALFLQPVVKYEQSDIEGKRIL